MAKEGAYKFSKYTGRRGPAIEPGTLAMMGSIGEEYAKGINKLGQGIASYFAGKDEAKKIEKENEIIFDILNPDQGTKHSPEKERKYEIERKESVESARKKAVTKREEYEKATSEAGEDNVLSGLDNLEEEINFFNLEIPRLDRQIDAAEASETNVIEETLGKEKYFNKFGKIIGGSIPSPPTIAEIGQDPIGSLLWKTPNPIGIAGALKDTLDEVYADAYNTLGDMAESGQPKMLVNKSGELKRARNNATDRLSYLKRLHQMELDNPGSTLGRGDYQYDSKSGLSIESKSKEDETVKDRLNIYEKFIDMPDAGKGDIRLHQLIPQYLSGSKKEEDVSRLMNFGTYPKSQIADAKLNEYRTAEKEYYGVLNVKEKSKKDFMVPLTEQEKFSRALASVEAGEVRAGFAEKLAGLLDKLQGPKMTILTHPDTGEKMVALRNTHHMIKSGLTPSEERAGEKYRHDYAEGARRAIDKVEDDRDSAYKDLRDRRALLEEKNELGTLTPTEEKELAKLVSGETLRELDIKYATRTGRVTGNFPEFFRDRVPTEIEVK